MDFIFHPNYDVVCFRTQFNDCYSRVNIQSSFKKKVYVHL